MFSVPQECTFQMYAACPSCPVPSENTFQGSFVTFGGNGAIGPGGNIGSVRNPSGASGAWDATYQDFDGSRAIRILNPCTSSDDFSSAECEWFDNPDVLSMQKQRWYSATEMLGDGTIVIIG